MPIRYLEPVPLHDMSPTWVKRVCLSPTQTPTIPLHASYPVKRVYQSGAEKITFHIQPFRISLHRQACRYESSIVMSTPDDLICRRLVHVAFRRPKIEIAFGRTGLEARGWWGWWVFWKPSSQIGICDFGKRVLRVEQAFPSYSHPNAALRTACVLGRLI